jgi:predicted anti-sigma-YlaC factor YlaD
MMISCRKATHLMSQELDRELTTGERMRLRFHVMMCSACTNFRRNMTFLRTACSQVVQEAREERPEQGNQ